ncbi:TetR/AcrR family transcriptional regulator [Bacillus haynesii]|uniref:TetR/AcrR family transcriptional regulator n=1 Tax=Bacillus haynesii TaxID=1925021 RepID=UPI002281E2CA|nr:TetR/AcrR family transcriptional regulator [Bacillus haynesii]MCY8381290.1 TetR/AcrR family transcriptional regulator [Bacillus haynesii]MEC0676505.1 TetR/AcrR family transcriptional regulator [Bacillus haynesii]
MQETNERIITAALDLMQKYGFKSVTIKDIALHSGVSEMTVYRHFKTKLGLLEAAVQQFSYIPAFQRVFENDITWNLEKDLTLIAESYLLHMENNKPLYLIAVQDGGRMTDLFGSLLKHMEELLSYLTDYFQTMQDKSLMKKGDPGSQAFTFLSTLYGYFSSGALAGGRFQKTAKDTYIKQITAAFCGGLHV